MKHMVPAILLWLILSMVTVLAQDEMEIKTTGKFIYSWALEKSEQAARETAKLGLLDTIYVSLLKQTHVDIADTLFIRSINYFVKKVGFKWQAIAFADKSDIRLKVDLRKQLQVIPIIIEKKEVTSESVVPGRSRNENEVLSDLLACRDSKSLEQHLIRHKADLKLNYGDKLNYPDDSSCYVFVVDKVSFKVSAVIDKGPEPRKNILTGSQESNYMEKYPGDHFVYVIIVK